MYFCNVIFPLLLIISDIHVVFKHLILFLHDYYNVYVLLAVFLLLSVCGPG